MHVSIKKPGAPKTAKVSIAFKLGTTPDFRTEATTPPPSLNAGAKTMTSCYERYFL